jgi:hypothetical protein
LLGGSASPVIAAALGANRPSYNVFDWNYFASVARNDAGGSAPLLCARAYYPTGPATGYGNTSVPVATGNIWNAGNAGNSYNQGRPVSYLSAVGDFASGNYAAFSAGSPTTNFGMLIGEAEFMHTCDVMTVVAMGDSISQGDLSTYNLLSPVHLACAAISTLSRPVVACNQGFSSQTTTNFVARLQDMIASGRKPSVCVYSAWSPNDVANGTDAVVAAAILVMRKNLVIALNAMRNAGIVPVIATGGVHSSAGTTIAVSAATPSPFDGEGYGALAWTPIGEITNLGDFGREYNLVTHNGLGANSTGKLKGSFNEGSMACRWRWTSRSGPGDAEGGAGQTMPIIRSASSPRTAPPSTSAPR